MEALSLGDTQKLHQSIQQIYTLHNLETFGESALSIVDRLVPGDAPQFHLTNLRTRQISSTFLPDFPGFTPEMERAIEQHFGEHPIAQQMPQSMDGVYQISDFITRRELHLLEGLYQQFFRLLDVEDQMTFFLPNVNLINWHRFLQPDVTLVGVSIHRNWGGFSERDRSVLNLLRQHLSQAYSNAQHYQELQQDAHQLQQSLNHLGAIILGAEGQIQSIASQAIIWLETYFSKPTTTRQLPDHLWSWVKHQIACLAKTTDPSQACVPLRIQQAGRELTIRLAIEQIGARYLLLLSEQTLSSLNSLELLGLSQRETEVLGLVMQGKDNKSIASQLSIHSSTVNKHLENIYPKLGAQSRTEAIAQALEKLGFFHSLPLN